MNKAVLILLTILIVSPAFAYDLGEPPEPQDGDEEEVTCTVGEMRTALWYHDQALACEDYATNLEEQIDTMNERDAEEDAEFRAEIRTLKNQRRLLIGATAVETIIILGIIGFSSLF